MKLSKVFLLSTLACTCKAAEEAAHSCACEAEELGFQINCAATDVMLSSMAFLKSSGCATDCSSPECEKNYLIVQSHHDYCPEAGVPEEVCSILIRMYISPYIFYSSHGDMSIICLLGRGWVSWLRWDLYCLFHRSPIYGWCTYMPCRELRRW